MKTIRQVKTVFIIFIAFVCCWSPYIVVLLYDNSNRLPLPVHLYASMLAHLHASLNFAIYGLMNRNLRSGFGAHVMACCCHVSSRNAATTVAATTHASARRSCNAQHSSERGTGYKREVDVNRSFLAVEYYQLRATDGYSGRDEERCSQPPFSVCITEEHECHSTIVQC